MKGLTRRQQEVLDYIREHVRDKGYPPSVREIAARFGLVSAAGIHKHIKALVRKNVLSKDDFLSRSLRVLGDEKARAARGEALIELPLAGYVAAGQPIEAIQQSNETLAVPASLVGPGRGHYVLKVRGDSMVDDGILDGDYVIVEPRETARNGEAVIALVNGQETTLKRFFREEGAIRLQPANPAMRPIVIRDQEVRVQGVVAGLWRRYA